MAKRTELVLTGLGFTSAESDEVVRTGKIHFFTRDSNILEPPFSGGSLYIVLEGKVQALAVDTDGEEVTVALYRVGEFFDGIELGDVPHTISVRALEPSRLLELRINWLKSLMPQASASAKQVIERLLIRMEKQGQNLSEAIQQKQAITEILRAISTSPSDLSSLLETVAENAAKLCDAVDASIHQVEDDYLV
jgi:CRP-like cAMP-binding protein